MNKADAKFEQMTSAPVEKLVCRMAAPTIIAMLVTAIYNMADTFFVGRIGTSATAAVGVVFSLMAIIQALGFFFGHGSGNYISRKLGAKDVKSAEGMASTAFFTAIIAGLILAVFGLIFIEPLAKLLGSTETILPYAVDYLRYILIATPFMMGAIVINNQLRFQGNALYSMIGLSIGGIVNIGLDPLFIFVFNMGVGGASAATALSQMLSFAILIFINRRKGIVPVSAKKFKPSLDIYKEVVRGGMPSLARQGLQSVATIILNTMSGIYGGDAAIAGMSIVTRVFMFANSVIIGFGQGFQPVCGFNYGAKLYERVKKAYKFCVKFSMLFLFIAAVILFIFAPQVIEFFRKGDQAVIDVGAFALRCQCITMPLMGIITMSNMMLQTIGKAVPATLVAMSRQFLFFLPALFILSNCIGLMGIEMTQAVADLCSLALTLPLTIKVLKEMSVPGQG